MSNSTNINIRRKFFLFTFSWINNFSAINSTNRTEFNYIIWTWYIIRIMFYSYNSISLFDKFLMAKSFDDSKTEVFSFIGFFAVFSKGFAVFCAFFTFFCPYLCSFLIFSKVGNNQQISQVKKFPFLWKQSFQHSLCSRLYRHVNGSCRHIMPQVHS